MEKEIIFKIYEVLQKDDICWHGFNYWKYADKFFEQFNYNTIQNIAQEMAELGIIETNNNGGFRRKEKTLKEKFFIMLDKSKSL